jgi:hypothetical protein
VRRRSILGAAIGRSAIWNAFSRFFQVACASL